MMAKKTKTVAVPQQNMQLITVDTIHEMYRCRVTWHKSEKILTLQARAVCRRVRGGDKDLGAALFDEIIKIPPDLAAHLVEHPAENPELSRILMEILPILQSRSILQTQRQNYENRYETLVWDLPIMEWANEISGVGPGSVAAIIGNTGNLWHYPTVQKFWNRMGLAVMPDGRRQRNIMGQSVADRTMGGYNAQRRSVVWNIGTSIMFAQTARVDKTTGEIKREAGEYRKIYDARRAYEEAKNERGEYAPLTAAIMKSSPPSKTTEAYKAYKLGKLPKGHLKARSQRYMEKELLKRFWVAWRKTMLACKPSAAELAAVQERLAKEKLAPEGTSLPPTRSTTTEGDTQSA